MIHKATSCMVGQSDVDLHLVCYAPNHYIDMPSITSVLILSICINVTSTTLDLLIGITIWFTQYSVVFVRSSIIC